MSWEPIVSSLNPLCLIGGASVEKTDISAAFHHVQAFIGVDGGANHLVAADISPAAVIGDLDSLSEHARASFADVLHHIPEQSTTDFEKALTRVSSPLILALGFTGGRMDHTLSVLNVMARFAERAIVLVDKDDVCFVAPRGKTAFDAAKGTRISIMPLGPATVTVSGLQWSFEQTLMTPAGFTSPSNAALGGGVAIQTDDPVLVTLPRALLETALTAAVRAK